MRSRGLRQTSRGAKRGTARAESATWLAPPPARRSPTCFPADSSEPDNASTSSARARAPAPRLPPRPAVWPRPLLFLKARALPPLPARWRFGRLRGLGREMGGWKYRRESWRLRAGQVVLRSRSVRDRPGAVPKQSATWCLIWGKSFTLP